VTGGYDYLAQFIAQDIHDYQTTVESLLDRDNAEPLPILSSLVDAVSERDRALLGELERLVREKRRAIDRERTK
jgi:hypothetical protein